MVGTIIDRMRAASEHGPKLYHATRLVLRQKPVISLEGSASPGWRSGLEPAAGWGEFLGDVPVVAVGEYERRRFWQQSCYYGAVDRVNEYTLLAAEALGSAPPTDVIPRASDQGLPIDRDIWSFVLYRVAMRGQQTMGLDVYGQSPYAGFVFPGLERVIACVSEERDRDLPMLTRFAEDYERGSGRPAEFLFGTLRLDVFAASVMVLSLFNEERGMPLSTDVADRDMGHVCQIEGNIARGASPPEGKTSLPPKVVPTQSRNEKRNRWIYERCVEGVAYAQIAEELKKHCDGADGWNQIETPQGIHQTAKEYARRHGLELPKRRGL